MPQRRISYWQLWQASESGGAHEVARGQALKESLCTAAAFLGIEVRQPLRLSERQALQNALDELSAQCGLRALLMDSNPYLSLVLPMIARRKKDDSLVLLLPATHQKWHAAGRMLSYDEVQSLFDDFVQLYPEEISHPHFSFAALAKKIAGYLPKGKLCAMAFLLALVLVGSVALLSLVFIHQDSVNKISFLSISLICFVVFLMFAHFSQVQLTRNWPLSHLWTLDFIYRRLFESTSQGLAKLGGGDIHSWLKKVGRQIKIYFLSLHLVALAAILVAGGLIALLYWQSHLGFVASIAVAGVLAFGQFLSQRQRFYQEQTCVQEAALSDQLDGFAAAFDALMGLQASTPAVEKIAQASSALKKHEERLFCINFFFDSAKLYLPLISVGLLVVGLAYFEHGAFADWQIVILLFMALILGRALAFLMWNVGTFLLNPLRKATAHKLDQQLALKTESRVKIIHMKGAIELVDVSFHYDDDSALVIKNTNLTISAGQFHRIAGPSGAGKTTLLRILMADLMPSRGQVIFDGQDVLSLDKAHLCQNFGVVQQDSFLMAGSVLDNILAGRKLPLKMVKDLLIRYEAFDQLLDLPMGLQTYVYWHAKNLSRLEQILILLARATVHRPKIVFLDEILVGLGPHEQAVLHQFLHEFPATKVLTAHDNKNIDDRMRHIII